MLTELTTNEDNAMKKAKERYVYTWKRDGKWVTHFNSIKGIPQEVITTPFNSFTPFKEVRKNIELLNPQYKVVRCRRHERTKSRIELFKRGGEWVAYFNNIKGMPQEVISTPFKSSEPFEIVRDSIKLSNPQCNVVWWSCGRGNNVTH